MKQHHPVVILCCILGTALMGGGLMGLFLIHDLHFLARWCECLLVRMLCAHLM